MGRAEKLSEMEMRNIEAWNAAGMSQREIAAKLGRSKTAVCHFLANPVDYRRKKHAGRKPKLDDSGKRMLFYEISGSTKSPAAVAASLNLPVTGQTVRNYMKKSGKFASKKKKENPILIDSDQKVAIIGSGLIGRSWAMLFASAGYHVSIYDIIQSQIQNALDDVEKQLEALEISGVLRGTLSAKVQRNLISGTSLLKDLVEKAFFVLECVPEVLEIKHKALSEVDVIMEDRAILASSTTSILASKLAENLKHAESFIVTNPVNPSYYVPLVELVPSVWTKPDVVTRTRALMVEIGQSPVTIYKELPGLALNRIQCALMNECYNLVEEGVLDTEDVDVGLSDGIGRLYAFIGPLETCHLNAEGIKNYLDRYREMIFTASSEMGPLRKMEGETADVITQSLLRRIPMENLDQARQRRDAFLVALQKLRLEKQYKK